MKRILSLVLIVCIMITLFGCSGKTNVKEDEVAVEQVMAEKEGIHVGDQIKVEHGGELHTGMFTVTAIINQPSYCYARPKDARGQSDIGIGSAYYYIAFSCFIEYF